MLANILRKAIDHIKNLLGFRDQQTAAIAARDATIQQQSAVISKQAQEIQQLSNLVEEDKLDDENLENAANQAREAKEAAEAALEAAAEHTRELEQQLAELDAAGAELATLISFEPTPEQPLPPDLTSPVPDVSVTDSPEAPAEADSGSSDSSDSGSDGGSSDGGAAE